jgi:hypothetical protein
MKSRGPGSSGQAPSANAIPTVERVLRTQLVVANFGRPFRKLKFLRRFEPETSCGSDFEIPPLTAEPDPIQEPCGVRNPRHGSEDAR